MPNIRSVIVALIALLALPAGAARAAPLLKICDDGAGWPPYSYADPQHPGEVIGASAELVREILRRAGYATKITLLPWRRCLADVEEGRAALLLNATFSIERQEKFLLSVPYYQINSALYYLESRYPVPPRLTSPQDMANYRFCGLFGYNYTMYGLTPTQLDTGAKDETARFEKLRLGRCDFVLGDLEILNGFSALGQLDLRGIRHIPIPGARPKELHVMVSRSSAGGEALLKIINDGIAATRADNSYARIFKKYGM